MLCLVAVISNSSISSSLESTGSTSIGSCSNSSSCGTSSVSISGMPKWLMYFFSKSFQLCLLHTWKWDASRLKSSFAALRSRNKAKHQCRLCLHPLGSRFALSIIISGPQRSLHSGKHVSALATVALLEARKRTTRILATRAVCRAAKQDPPCPKCSNPGNPVQCLQDSCSQWQRLSIGRCPWAAASQLCDYHVHSSAAQTFLRLSIERIYHSCSAVVTGMAFARCQHRATVVLQTSDETPSGLRCEWVGAM